jgi:hypothetical protein
MFLAINDHLRIETEGIGKLMLYTYTHILLETFSTT